MVVTSCYTEVMRLGYKVTMPDNKDSLVRIVWALYFTMQYYLVGDVVMAFLADSCRLAFPSLAALVILVAKHHTAISFGAYVLCLVWFVLRLEGNYIRR